MWKDATSYSKDDLAKEKRPRTFELKTEALRIVVTRLQGADPKAWFMHCDPLGISTRELDSAERDGAFAEALSQVRQRLTQMLLSLPPADELK